MAEAIARRRIAERGWTNVEVGSAGVAAFPGSPASAGAVRVSGARGLDLTGHRSAPLTAELAGGADLVLTMSSRHLMRVVELGAGERAAVITAFARGAGASPEAEERAAAVDEGVPDPIGGPDEEYAMTFDVLDDLIVRALERLAPVVEP